MTERPTAEREVITARAKWLDGKWAGWAGEIKGELRMSQGLTDANGCGCIGAQLDLAAGGVGSYIDFAEKFFGLAEDDSGFDYFNDWQAADVSWREEVAARLV